ncbi:MAG TPA: VanZ family protein, partial [Polyangiaceae bacterium]
PAAGYVAAIFYTGLIRLGHLPEVGFMPTDKFFHTVTFAGLVLFLVRALRFLAPRLKRAKSLCVAAVLSSVFGALLEVCQAFVPYRSADFWDWLADTVGAALAAGLLALVSKIGSRKAHD